jgi:hypothetical protein
MNGCDATKTGSTASRSSHAKKALDMKVNKTDANDAEGLAHLVRAVGIARSGSRV